MKRYFLNILVWVTQGFNTLLGGSPDESTSSRAFRLQDNFFWGSLYVLINFIFQDPMHCFDAYKKESVKKEAWLRHMNNKITDECA
jgi:hypothetical protein